MRRRSGPPLVALALLVAVPAGAVAHGGILLGSAVAGPYRTQVMAAPLVRPGERPAIDVTVYLSGVETNTPITDATVRTAVTVDGRTLRPPVRRIGGGYEAIVPVGDAYTVGRQRVVVDIAGPRGTGQVTVDPVPEDGGPPTGLLAGSGVLLLLLGAWVVRVRRTRARREADAPAS
ncbi:hypothetical protein [Patulibacter americanus]|uniref:hypothetical protein n=1 Tax=Patulibacter americanus TaxID=588672 RepID=UPI0012F80032|nr:hypothetical protein [Patulibacter americanus]